MKATRNKPLWLLIVIIAASLPVFAFPTILGMIDPANSMAKTMAWFYIIYVVITAALAWMCWPQRKYVTWILIIIMLLSHAAMWGLAFYSR